MTEKQYPSLSAADQQQVGTQLQQLRALAKATVQRGQELRTAGKFRDAEAHDRAALGLGRLLDRNPDGMLIVRLVGIAIQKLSLEELVGLYEAMNEPAKSRQAREQLDELKREQEKIRQKVGG